MTEQALEILRQGLDRLGLTYPPGWPCTATACWRKTR